jgi:hypothetical protein
VQLQTLIIANRSFTVAIPAEKAKEELLKINPKNTGEVSITITSKTNPLNTKSLTYVVN